MQIRLYIYSLLAMLYSLVSLDAVAEDHGEVANATEADGSTCIITTYSPNYRWSSRVINHVENTLMKKHESAVTTINMPIVDIETSEELDRRLKRMYEMLDSVKPKRIVLVGSSSFCLCETLDKWQSGIPMLLIGGSEETGRLDMLTSSEGMTRENAVSVRELQGKYNVTVQCMPVFIEKEIALIHKLLPNMKNLYFVGGDDQFSNLNEETVSKVVKKRGCGIRFIPLLSKDMSLDSLALRLSKLNPKTDAVIFSSWLNRVLFRESPVLMSRSLFFLNVATAPIFILRENGWMDDSQDILGGCFLDENHYYDHLDKVLEMFVGGTPARDIPSYKADEPIVKLNYTRLMAYGMDPKACPAGTIFTNQPMNVWEHYHNEITAIGIAFLVVLLILLFRAYRNSKQMRMMQQREMQAMQRELDAKRKNKDFIDNVPATYMRTRLVEDETGKVVNILIERGNKALVDKWMKRGVSVEGKMINDILPLAAPSFIYKLSRARDNGEKVVRTTLYLPDTGEYMFCLVYYYEDGSIGILTRDDTEIHRKTRELKEAKERAERSERIKREFINNITHELRTPLNAICGFTELITNPDAVAMLSEEEKTTLQKKVSTSTLHLVEMLTNILEYSDIVNGSAKNDISTCYVVGTARMAMQQMPWQKEDDVIVRLDAHVSEDIAAQMCQSRVLMVLNCMLSNACKFTSQGSIVLSVERDDETGKYKYVCTDTGCGVPPDKVDYIFEGFTQVDIFAQGTGLGLAICRLIADEMGGRIYLDTEYKGGSRFVFELP